MLLNHGDLFEPIDPRKRLFRKIADVGTGGAAPRLASRGTLRRRAGHGDQLEPRPLDAGPVASSSIDHAGRPVAGQHPARSRCSTSAARPGAPFQDLEVLPAGRAAVAHRARQHRAAPGRASRTSSGSAPGSVSRACYDVSVVPLYDAGSLPASAVSFQDVTIRSSGTS